MKFYETHYEDYYHSVEKVNYHPELEEQYARFPEKLSDFDNIIVYGPPGCGKYSQILYILQRYSPTALKYEKKITAVTEKQQYTYKISDIHYEIDMALLGCNSKVVWHECFTQIVDIVSMKQEKYGIIVCKNFHSVHNELLEIFYSYLQQHPVSKTLFGSAIQIKFILMTEHLSFMPTNIVNRCYVLNIPRPARSRVHAGLGASKAQFDRAKMIQILDNIAPEDVMNNKELYSFVLAKTSTDLPKDNFNTICDTIIEEMEHASTMSVANFRDNLYDILIYNLDAFECVWYVFSYFVKCGRFLNDALHMVMEKMCLFFKQFGNNYRAIFHLENVFFGMICAIPRNGVERSCPTIQYSISPPS
jgi:hypothetical protein